MNPADTGAGAGADVDVDVDVDVDDVDAAFAAEWTRDADGVWHRRAARVLLVAARPRPAVLLVRGHDADQVERSWWFTVGGGLAPGEDAAAGAARELAEETGIVVDPGELEGPVIERDATFDFFARTCRQHELIYLARAEEARAVTTDGWTPLEAQTLDELRWWPLEELAQAERGGVEVYPRHLAALVAQFVDGWDGVVRRLG